MDIDKDSGVVYFTNKASQEIELSFSILISNTGGSEPQETFNPTLQIDGFMVSTACGPESTKLFAPSLGPLYYVPNILPLLTITGAFESSNPTCPVISNRLLAGEDNYEF